MFIPSLARAFKGIHIKISYFYNSEELSTESKGNLLGETLLVISRGLRMINWGSNMYHNKHIHEIRTVTLKG